MQHDRDFDPAYGTAIEVADGVRRLTCENPSPFTFFGTNCYIIGQKNLIVVDPGPNDRKQVETLLKVTHGANIEAILVTHTHADHSPAARLLQDRTGAQIIGCEPHRPSREVTPGEINPLDSSVDTLHAADRIVSDGEKLIFSEATLEVVGTPGHTANHLSFALSGTEHLFSGDHVMAWSTTIVAPPDGSMRDYMSSLDVLASRPETHYLPGHGGVVRDTHSYLNDLKQHRLGREADILSALVKVPCSIEQLVDLIYVGLDPTLKGAAGLSVLAHLEDLEERGRIQADRSGTSTVYSVV